MQGLWDWIHLLVLASILTLASILQAIIITFYRCFPFPSLLDRLFLTSKGLQSWFSYRLGLASDNEHPARLQAEALVKNHVKSCPSDQYILESHCVETRDGFVLVLHRIVPVASEGMLGEKQEIGKQAPDSSIKKRPPVLIMHALMQDSESFLCGGQHSLAFFLARAGFDVWLGNNRGNRYSHKHVSFKPSEDRYWNFSIDELARFDVPALINYVLSITGFSSLRYIGFSQGSAQAFAAFTLDPLLATKVKLFIALAAPPRAKGLSASFLSSLVESNPRFIFLLFGRHAMLSSTLMWMRIMSPQLFVRTVDTAIRFLFRWSASEVASLRKVQLYQHIFSYASVKVVVHWFQLIKLRRLVMYQDSDSVNRIPVEYDLSRLQLPVALFYGGRDTVIDIDALLKDLNCVVYKQKEDPYEHLDLIWADSAVAKVFPKIASLLKDHC